MSIENIIRENDEIIQEIKDSKFDTNTIHIVAKGPTSKYVPGGVGINQAVINTDFDFLFMNDFENMFGIEEYFPKIKYIFTPFHPHTKGEMGGLM